MKKERLQKVDRFKIAREEGIFAALASGKTRPEEINESARKFERSEIQKIGTESEENFIAYAESWPRVERVEFAAPEDDVFLGIDMWIQFREEEYLPKLPVQVKSSYADVKLFMFGDKGNPKTDRPPRKPDPMFTSLGGLMIVVNCGPSIAPKDLKRQLRGNIARIREIIRQKPELVNLLMKLETPEA